VEAVAPINQFKSDVLKQYQDSLNKSRDLNTVAMAKSFLSTLKHQPDPDATKVRGLETGVLVCNLLTGLPMHVLPTQRHCS